VNTVMKGGEFLN